MSNNKKQPKDEDILVLHDEDGNKERYEIIDTVEYDNRDFIVLLPLPDDGEPNEDMLYVLEVVEDLDDPEYDNYIGIEDDETIDAVFEIFKEQYFKD